MQAQLGQMSESRTISEAERDSNPVTSLMQARRALRVIHRIEISRARRRATEEGVAAGHPSSRTAQHDGLGHSDSKPRPVALVAPTGLIREATAGVPLTGVEVHNPAPGGFTGETSFGSKR